MSVDPTTPITRPEELPTADQDLDPDAKDDEDFEEDKKESAEARPEDWQKPDAPRPPDWNEPPAATPVPPPDEPTPLSDDLR
ncbi:hypothetical protein [Pseudomonas sp. SLFW]|uniref:hypothetical protein n=1 Tax=Pseudomonas TaxID=286 RepID=UPI0014128C0E|nr:hypothetical protein [Pseudomonas sp. SLFW]NBB12981.1 hypothetical protein [Pseudomonas sp. SLFW]